MQFRLNYPNKWIKVYKEANTYEQKYGYKERNLCVFACVMATIMAISGCYARTHTSLIDNDEQTDVI